MKLDRRQFLAGLSTITTALSQKGHLLDEVCLKEYDENTWTYEFWHKPPTEPKWHHVCIMKVTGRTRVWVDGEQVADGPSAYFG